MSIEQIAVRFTDHPYPTPGDVPIDHPYRQRWWLPIIGPTATCLLNHLGQHADEDTWRLHPARTLAATIGLGRGAGKHSPLIRSLNRLTRFGFGHFDIEPGDQSDPCITLYRTIGLPSPRLTKNWPDDMQQAHALELAEMYHQAS